MTVFAAALGAIFRDPNMAVDAWYRAGGLVDGQRLIRVIRKRPDQDVGFNGASFVTSSDLLDVQISDVPALEVGDQFEIGGELFEVSGEPSRDVGRMLWTATILAV